MFPSLRGLSRAGCPRHGVCAWVLGFSSDCESPVFIPPLPTKCHPDRSGPIFSSAPLFGASGRAVEGSWHTPSRFLHPWFQALLFAFLAFLCDLCAPSSVISVLPSLSAFLPLPPQRRQKLPHPQRIDHVRLLQPPSPRHLHPIPDQVKFAALCESVEITTFTPRSLHILRYTSFKSSRSGYELHSIATPCFAQAASTFSMS